MKLRKSAVRLGLACVALTLIGILARFGRSEVTGAVRFSPDRSGGASVGVRPAAPAPARGLPLASPAATTTRSASELWRLTRETMPDSETERRFHAFQQWLVRFAAADAAGQSELLEEGVRLATKRRDEMFDLIQADPKRALELSVPGEVRALLPPGVVARLETPVSARGDLAVFCGAEHAEHFDVFRTADFGDRVYRAFVYGKRAEESTRFGIPLSGIVLDEVMAVRESAVTRLAAWDEAGQEGSGVSTRCALCEGELPASGAIRLEVGGVTQAVCSEAHFAALTARLDADSTTSGNEAAPASPLAASAWTEGTKSLLFIRVDFSDLAGEPFSDSRATNLVQELDAFYRESSYGKARFFLVGEGSEYTPVFRMPQTAQYYGTNDASKLRRDARSAATAAGFTLADYDIDLVCMGAVPGFKWAGLGYVGSAGVWIRATSSVGVVAHEIGHNLGLNHANFWDTGGESVIGSGASIEYGDKFDTMGSANAGSKHFNARYKNYLNWITGTQLTVANESGTYRIGAHDREEAKGVLALRVTRNTSTNYWVEFRQKYTSNRWLMNGASIRWARGGNQSSLLLDTTPGSPDGKDDAAIEIGRTFSDAAAGVHITPVGFGPDFTVDLAVRLGAFNGNHAPELELSWTSNQVAVGGTLKIQAKAQDADQDSLAYYWDLGDGTANENLAEREHAWKKAGDLVVRCVVSDLKGGLASRHALLRVGSPSTYRISGSVVSASGPLQGARVYVSSSQVAYTDSDGDFVLTGLSAGSYTVRAMWEGWTFSAIGSSGVVRVGPANAQVRFVAVAPDQRVSDMLVARGSLWQYLDDGSDRGTAWRSAGFDDRTWSEGPAPLGYGDDVERTPVRYGTNASLKHVTTYFRQRFTVDNPAAYTALRVGLRRDDGGAVYLNGQEVFRSNLPTGSLRYNTLASATVGGSDESTFFETDLAPSFLVAGTNIVAVEIHQSSRSSSDIVFDLELVGFRAAAVGVPSLRWEAASGGIQFLWPESPVPWALFSAAQLGAKSVWSPVTGALSTNGNGIRLQVDASEAQRFYQLALP